jgi:diaminopimelate epimerase
MIEQIEFFKMSGAGNDFILGDNRQGAWSGYSLDRLARGLCRRGTSVGADGLILLEGSGKAHFRIRIFNRDGTHAAMCGNGARCAARYAFLKVIAGRQMNIEAPAGVFSARVLPDSRVEVEIPGATGEPEPISLEIQGRTLTGLLAHTGVPHLVVFVRDAASVPVASLGAALRSAPELGPEGANVDFVSTLGGEPFPMRTYERGVEAETLACGTGAAAVAWVLHRRGLGGPKIRLAVRSGRELTVEIAEHSTAFRLTGEARVVFRGVLLQESIEEALRCG